MIPRFLSVATCLLMWLPLAAEDARSVMVKGRWVMDPRGGAVAPPLAGGRMMGLQTSGLSYDGVHLWSVGDQRTNYPASIFKIEPPTGRLAATPMRLAVTAGTQGDIPLRLPNRNPDLEAIWVGPDSSPWYIAIESDGLQVLECAFDPRRQSLSVLRVLTAEFDHPPAEGDSNRRFEGIVVGGENLYLGYEKDATGHPHVYWSRVPVTGTRLGVTELPIPFAMLPPRPGKGGVNINGLAWLRDGTALLIMVARDQERLLFYEPGSRQLSYLDLDFRDPEGREIYWTSPEGVAADGQGDRLWVVSDPDSQRGNYRLRSEAAASGNYRAMVPLLFELRLSEVLKARVRVP